MSSVHPIPPKATDLHRRRIRLRRSAARRYAYALCTAAVCSALAQPVLMDLVGERGWRNPVAWRAGAVVVGSATLLVWEIARRWFSLPVAIFHGWVFVFMGLAGTAQIASGQFPWRGRFSESNLVESFNVLILGCLATGVGIVIARRRGSRRLRAPFVRTEPEVAVLPIRRLIERACLLYVFIAVSFVAAMGPAMLSGRAVYRSRLLEVAALPFGATLAFLASAGAILVPAYAIVARREGVPVRRTMIALAVVAGMMATNPLLGSRFLTGSALVALGAAAIGRRDVCRLLPVTAVVLLVAVFPTLDVLRGDGTGSNGIGIVPVEESLLSYDFDAFEMMTREAALTAEQRSELPSRASVGFAPIARWIPVVARAFENLAAGEAVAKVTGMTYTYVSMPLFAEGHVYGGLVGVILLMGATGLWLGRFGLRDHAGVAGLRAKTGLPASAALLFIVLRGPLYEVFGYVGLVWILNAVMSRVSERGALKPPRAQRSRSEPADRLSRSR